ncbi:hypothetical protein EJ02DRAFT_175192 [Clathrospora elynae]|uniref:Uncharacterized protein n=1 Tax=Clathrospora elynae TaxID=706981 RepID=A0A6A5T3E3_9PLEO|nr:hypothetical protein EJ02DRAFT_175192 [Clathrospora elynae]
MSRAVASAVQPRLPLAISRYSVYHSPSYKHKLLSTVFGLVGRDSRHKMTTYSTSTSAHPHQSRHQHATTTSHSRFTCKHCMQYSKARDITGPLRNDLTASRFLVVSDWLSTTEVVGSLRRMHTGSCDYQPARRAGTERDLSVLHGLPASTALTGRATGGRIPTVRSSKMCHSNALGWS